MSSEKARPTKSTCVCCRNLGVLPHTDTTEVYDAVAGRMVQVQPGQMVASETVQQMCDECVIAAFLSGGTKPHPHRLSRSLFRGAEVEQ